MPPLYWEGVMNCKNPKCGKPLVGTGRRHRQYCNGACKQAYYRFSHPTNTDQEERTALIKELEDARATIVSLEQENTRLLNKLDVERRFSEDYERRGFKYWLEKQPVGHVGVVARRILSDDFIPAMGSRAAYEAHLRKNGYTTDEIERFRDLWKLMLLS
jgi:hypothetical protein